MKDESMRRGLRVVAFVDGKALHGDVEWKAPDNATGIHKGKWLVRYDGWKLEPGWHYAKEIRPERFMEFCTLRHGFGRTNWWSFGLIQLMCFLLVFLTIRDGEGSAIAIISATVIEGVLVLGTFMNFKGYWK